MNYLLNKDRVVEINDTVNHLTSDDFELTQMDLILSITQREKILLEEGALEDISGILTKRDNKWVIMVNSEDSMRRKLFTIAHELGHYFLHKDNASSFVDSPLFSAQYNRNENEKYTNIELEANEFAGVLLMSENMITKKLPNKHKRISDSDLKDLAALFGVSTLALSTRLKNLEYAL